jgi:hypothetical protein
MAAAGPTSRRTKAPTRAEVAVNGLVTHYRLTGRLATLAVQRSPGGDMVLPIDIIAMAPNAEIYRC